MIIYASTTDFISDRVVAIKVVNHWVLCDVYIDITVLQAISHVTGNVKSEENFFYPPESTLEPPSSSFYVTPRLVPLQKSSSSPPTRRSVERDSAYSQRARCGFKYWPQEPKPIDCKLLGVCTTVHLVSLVVVLCVYR